jgi:hypothetical protein
MPHSGVGSGFQNPKRLLLGSWSRHMKSDLIDLTVIVRHTTERGVLVYCPNADRQEWVPLSQVELAADENGKTHTLTIPEWLAIDKELV